MLDYDAVLNFHQPPDGYRFSVDSILLADFVAAPAAKSAADFGAGCGVVGLCALEKGRCPGLKRMYFIEREPELLTSLEQNVALYRPRTAVELVVLAADWRELRVEDFDGGLDYAMANPPYYPLGTGRTGSRPTVEAARREIHGGLEELIAALNRLLDPDGRLALVLPARRRTELVELFSKYNLEAIRLKMAGTTSAGQDRLVLAEAAGKGEAYGRLRGNRLSHL